jgi:hypothetical protein
METHLIPDSVNDCNVKARLRVKWTAQLEFSATEYVANRLYATFHRCIFESRCPDADNQRMHLGFDAARCKCTVPG